MPRTIKVDLFTDTVCPWCLVGAERLDQAIAALPEGIEVEVENHPFYLNPNTPAEGIVVADMLREKYGKDPKELWARVESEAQKSGIDLDLSQQPRSYPTQKGHTLVRLARDKGTQHALANAIAWAYFMITGRSTTTRRSPISPWSMVLRAMRRWRRCATLWR